MSVSRMTESDILPSGWDRKYQVWRDSACDKCGKMRPALASVGYEQICLECARKVVAALEKATK